MIYIKLLIIVCCFFIPSQLFAGRNIDLPFSLNFDTDNYSDLLWVENGTTHTRLTSGCWSGACSKFTPPTTGQVNHGLGQFTGLQGDNTTQINIRFLIYYGSGWQEYMQGLKMIITNPVNQSRMMMFTDEPGEGDLADDFATYGACYQGNICKYDNDTYDGQWPQSEDSFRIGDRSSGFREEEWICVEYEANTVTGVSRVYVHTTDEVFSGVYTQITNPNSDSSIFDYIDIIGGYQNNNASSNANFYWIIDELVISDEYIGPPAGFLSEPPVEQTISGGISGGGWKVE